MGRSEGNSSAGAIAVVVIAGILLMLLIGCGGLATFGWLFAMRAPTPASVAYTKSPSPIPNAVGDIQVAYLRTISNDAEGRAVMDGKPYTDEQLRQQLAADQDAGRVNDFHLQLTDDLAPDRRAAIEQIVADYQAANSSVDPAPQQTTP
jgi:hypothetical protein